ncbi:MAG: signal peptidase I [Thermoproteota archaeon]
MGRKWSASGKLSQRSLLRFTGYFLLVLIVFLALARFIDFPVSMFMVGGRSMEPTLYVGDLVFSVKGNYTVGDIVVVEGVNRVNCIVHRVVEISESSVTTKGDANPGPDNPISRKHVLYKVVFIVPRLLWIPPFLAVSFFIVFRYLKSLIRGAEIGRTLLTIVLFFSILDIVTMTVIPVFHVHQSIDVKRPNIVLRSISLSEDFRFFRAVYGGRSMLEFVRVDWVKINASGREFYPDELFIEDDTLFVRVPQEVYDALYHNSSSITSSFWVYCNIVFDKGNLYGYYPVTFAWRRLEVNVANNTFIVNNPNPVAFNASFEIQYYDLDRFGRPYYVGSDRFNKTLQPVSSFVVKPEKRGVHCYVIMRYVLLGGNVMESRKVDIVGE